jgi:hypothetical protein
VFLQLSWIILFGKKWAFVHFQNSDLQEVFPLKLTQFSQGNNVLDAAASNIDGILSRDTCVSLTQLNRTIWSTQSLLAPWSTKVAGCIHLKTNSTLTEKEHARCYCSDTHGFLSRGTCVSSTQLSVLFGTKWGFLHLENFDLKEEFLSKTNSINTGEQCDRCCRL